MGVEFQSTGEQRRRGGLGDLASFAIQLSLLPEQYRLASAQRRMGRRNRKQILESASQESAAIMGQAQQLVAGQTAAYGAAGLETGGVVGTVTLDTLLQGLVESRRAEQSGIALARGYRSAGRLAREGQRVSEFQKLALSLRSRNQ